MEFRKVSPLGPRNGPGTFDAIFNDQKYKTMEEALAANDIVVIDFVVDENNIIYFQAYHSQTPDVNKVRQLQIQHFPFGIDMFDDQAAMDLAQEFLK